MTLFFSSFFTVGRMQGILLRGRYTSLPPLRSLLCEHETTVDMLYYIVSKDGRKASCLGGRYTSLPFVPRA